MNLELALAHGPAVTVVGGLAFTALVVVLFRRWSRGTVEAPAPDGEEEGLEEGRRAVTGVLRADGEGVTVDVFEQRPGIVSAVCVGSNRGTVASDGLTLESDGEPIRIDGAVQLVWGSEIACPGARFGRLPAMRREVLERHTGDVSDPNARPVFHTLRAGDRVRVVASFTREAGDTSGDYRAPSQAWQAKGGGDYPVSLAFVGRPRIHAPSWGRTVAVGAAALAFATGGVYLLGERALESLPNAYSGVDYEAPPLDGSDAWCAAMSPWHNGPAGAWAARMSEIVSPQSEATALRHMAIVDAASGCRDAVATAVQHGLVERARERADACGIPLPPSAYCREARFDGVEEVLTDHEIAGRDVAAFLLGGDREGALAAARATAVHEREAAEAHGARFGDVGLRRREARQWDALAAVLADDAHSGVEGSEADILVARLLRADLASGAERAERAEALFRDSESRGVLLGLILLAEVDPGRAAEVLSEGIPYSVYRAGREHALRTPRPGLRQAIGATEARAETGPERALLGFLRLLRFDELTAQARLTEARTLLTAALEDVRVARALEPAAVVEDGETAPEDEALVPAEGTGLPASGDALAVIEQGLLFARCTLALEAGDEEEAVAIASTDTEFIQDRVRRRIESRRRPPSSGEPWGWHDREVDGVELAWLLPEIDPLGRLHDPWRLPVIDGHRDALVGHLRWASDGKNEGCWADMRFERAVRALRLSRALDQPDWHEEELARVERFDAAFTDRALAMPVYVALNMIFLD